MLLFGYKLFSSVRKAIAGRKHPAQLAWAVGFGVLLGLIPHGNVVAVGLGVLVLCMHVNHAMTALVTVLVTLGAPRLDPLFHTVGKRVLTEPRIANTLSVHWDAPLMAWTDLNNTVMAGSLTVGLAALLPVVLITLPCFRLVSGNRAAASEQDVPTRSQSKRNDSLLGARPHKGERRPHIDRPRPTLDVRRVSDDEIQETDETAIRVLDRESVPDATQTEAKSAVDAFAETNEATEHSGPKSLSQPAARLRDSRNETEQEKIDEALRYLLRQLRDTNEKEAA
ncbi:MAG: TIGR03546 family protein [Planctomycetota bacterium]